MQIFCRFLCVFELVIDNCADESGQLNEAFGSLCAWVDWCFRVGGSAYFAGKLFGKTLTEVSIESLRFLCSVESGNRLLVTCFEDL